MPRLLRSAKSSPAIAKRWMERYACPVGSTAVGSKPTAKKSTVASINSNPNVVHTYPSPLIAGTLIKRYKRFLADVEIPTASNEKQVITVYCPNTGPMIGLLDECPNAPVRLSKSTNPKRKLAYTLEMIQIPSLRGGDKRVWVGVHSSLANSITNEAMLKNLIPEVGGAATDVIRKEVKHAEGSRIDFVLEKNQKDNDEDIKTTFVEVKSVTLAESESHSVAVFPDTVSKRAHKHMEELIHIKNSGGSSSSSSCAKAVFIIQRGDCTAFAPSTRLDPKFSELCGKAYEAGVELIAYSCTLHVPIDENELSTITLDKQVQLDENWLRSIKH